jgi:hypothetical protein
MTRFSNSALGSRANLPCGLTRAKRNESADQFYFLRTHISFVRDRLDKGGLAV